MNSKHYFGLGTWQQEYDKLATLFWFGKTANTSDGVAADTILIVHMHFGQQPGNQENVEQTTIKQTKNH